MIDYNEIKAEIITIGDEILIGQIHDTNATWISQELSDSGIRTVRRTTIADKEKDILEAFEEAESRAEIILITGGLGPTDDDLTKPCLAKYFDSKISMHSQALAELTELFESRGYTLSDRNRQQAALPEKCTMISNPHGSAAGMWFDKGDKVFASMPGVPHEMKAMMLDSILPKVRKKYKTKAIVHKTVKTTGIGESWLADKLESWEKVLPEHISLAYLPSPGSVRLRLTARGDEKSILKKEIDREVESLKKIADKYIYGYDDDTLEKVIGEHLRNSGKTLAIAESCTGGFVAHKFTSVSGSSDYFQGGIIPYQNEMKTKLLNVKEQTLISHGAVSEETVTQMATNVKELYNADIGIATSGIAGPGGGTIEKPVGLVWIAMANDHEVQTKKLQFGKQRQVNIQRTNAAITNLLWQSLKENN